MKRILHRALALITGGVLVLGLAACQPQQEQAAATPASTEQAATPTPAVPTPAEQPTPPIEDGPGDFDEPTIAALNGMQAVYDSCVRALTSMPEEARFYDKTDPMFFWEVLYHMCANFSELHPLGELSGAQYILPAVGMHEFADACFFGLEELPEIPPQTFDIVYDEETETYHIGMSDAGDAYAEPMGYATNAAGNIEATIAWKTLGEEAEAGGEDRIFVFELVPNENAADGEPVFQFSVLRAYEQGADIGGIIEIDMDPIAKPAGGQQAGE